MAPATSVSAVAPEPASISGTPCTCKAEQVLSVRAVSKATADILKQNACTKFTSGESLSLQLNIVTMH